MLEAGWAASGCRISDWLSAYIIWDERPFRVITPFGTGEDRTEERPILARRGFRVCKFDILGGLRLD